MLEVNSKSALHQIVSAYPEPIGFVPLTFDLHEGHLSLIRKAREENNTVVVSLFDQVKMGHDLSVIRLPINMKEDKLLLLGEDVDIFFSAGSFPGLLNCEIEIKSLSNCWEGIRYPQHFRRVATTIFIILSGFTPSSVYLGEKDFQQVRVITELVNCFFPYTQIRPCPTLRDHNGLALSTSNRSLSLVAQKQAGYLYKALLNAQEQIDMGEHNATALSEMITNDLHQHEFQVDYLGIVDPVTLIPVSKVDKESRVLVAVFLKGIRLTDTIALLPHSRDNSK